MSNVLGHQFPTKSLICKCYDWISHGPKIDEVALNAMKLVAISPVTKLSDMIVHTF